ncbi:hypothetical protein HII17_15440 [Thalassotalea sp. M1531]|uniref:Uncharacterized protein n=1 Tax=Thalassotalea algicola TaxID=2716224 RepID=A0A7Y0LEH1_9GAMM|nr:hypothetical protein [Thalassotalea algicola]NMP32951.1 hypothetical protein [Thalassotalea algicola]
MSVIKSQFELAKSPLGLVVFSIVVLSITYDLLSRVIVVEEYMKQKANSVSLNVVSDGRVKLEQQITQINSEYEQYWRNDVLQANTAEQDSSTEEPANQESGWVSVGDGEIRIKAILSETLGESNKKLKIAVIKIRDKASQTSVIKNYRENDIILGHKLMIEGNTRVVLINTDDNSKKAFEMYKTKKTN